MCCPSWWPEPLGPTLLLMSGNPQNQRRPAQAPLSGPPTGAAPQLSQNGTEGALSAAKGSEGAQAKPSCPHCPPGWDLLQPGIRHYNGLPP